MDNQKGEVGGMDARALTAEIERATNQEYQGRLGGSGRGDFVGTTTREQGERLGGDNVFRGYEMRAAMMPAEEVRRLGSAAMTTREGMRSMVAMASGEEGRSAEGLRRAEMEVRRDELELERPEEMIGEESRLQVAEHLAEDREDLQHELGQGLRFEVKATERGQEEVTRKVVPEVEKIVNRSSFRVRELEDVYRRGVNATLGVFNRRIGDRNGIGGSNA